MRDIELICKLNKDWQEGEIKVKKAGGQTNRNYIVEFKKKKFFVRLPWERNDIVDRESEAKNILAISKNKKLIGVIPKFFLYVFKKKNILNPREKIDFPDGTMMMEYIPGRLFDISLFRKKEYQKKLAKAFYKFHTSGVRFVNEYNVFRNEIKKYRLVAKKYAIGKIINAEMINILVKIEEEAQKRVISLKNGVSTHNDFIFQNFILGDDGKVYILDFEYAGLNRKGGILYDFAFLFADNLFHKPPMTKEMFESFLKVADKIYGKTLDRSQIYWLVLSVPVMQIWWGLLRYFSVKTKKEKKYFKIYVLKRAKGILKLYHSIK